MSRSSAVWPVIVVTHMLCAPDGVKAQTNPPAKVPIAPSLARSGSPEMRELRSAIEQQTKQIEALGQQIAKLAQAIEGHKETTPAAATPPATPAEATPAEPPKAVAVADPQARHVVEKGETLTSIAKRFNISIAELQKVNKIENERKLQIGQSLVIPSSKTPEQQPEKKENP